MRHGASPNNVPENKKEAVVRARHGLRTSCLRVTIEFEVGWGPRGCFPRACFPFPHVWPKKGPEGGVHPPVTKPLIYIFNNRTFDKTKHQPISSLPCRTYELQTLLVVQQPSEKSFRVGYPQNIRAVCLGNRLSLCSNAVHLYIPLVMVENGCCRANASIQRS